ncbi:SMP-30/gluconolactonase/LRE family protein [Endothiovibrio diazotrophicus]
MRPIRRWASALLLSSLPLLAPLPADAARVQVIARGSNLHMANGIDFGGPDGRLYVVSGPGSRISVMNRRSGNVLHQYDQSQFIYGSDDVAVAPDGTLFFTNIFDGTIGRIDPDGSASLIAQLPPGPNGITLAEDGRLYANTTILSDSLWEIDPTGATPPRLIVENQGYYLNAMDVGPDGFIYAPAWLGDHTVLRIDPDSGAVTRVADGFLQPLAVKFDRLGRLHVLDSGDNTITRVDLANDTREVVAQLPHGTDNFVFDDENTLYATNHEDGAVRKVLPHGRLRVINRKGMILPGGIVVRSAANGADRLIVGDFFSLRHFDVRGRHARQVDTDPQIFGNPQQSVATNSTLADDGEHLILSTWFLGGSVQVWDPQTKQVVEVHTDLAQPTNAIPFDGGIAVAQGGTGTVVRLADRAVLGSGFTLPTGMAAVGGDLYVADYQEGAVYRITAGGVPLATRETVATGLSGPEGMTAEAAGTLLVVEGRGRRLSRIDPASGTLTAVADGLGVGNNTEGVPLTVPSWMSLSSVAVNPEGVIYVTGDRAADDPDRADSVIYRITE